LTEKYGFTDDEILFFRLHIVADTEHGRRGYEIVERLADSAEKKAACLRAVREATLMRRLYLDALYDTYVAPKLAASHA
jgi:pyrroloquinoline-quinone synthase